MKILCLVAVVTAVFAVDAAGVISTVSYDSFSPKEQEAWGYKLKREASLEGYASFELIIPPNAAKLIKSTSLQIRDKQREVLFIIHPGLSIDADGTGHIRIERLRGDSDAILSIVTDEMPGAPYIRNFLGFSFAVPPEHPQP